MESKNQSKWVYRPYYSSARTDDLQMMHWEKYDVEYIDYAFAKFNKRLQLIDFDGI